MEFEEFAARAREIESASADQAIVELVTDLLADAGPDLPVVARFVQGRVFPAWESTTLDVGPSTCYEAIARAAGQNVSSDDVEARLADVGEIGEVAAGYDLGGQTGLGAFTGGGSEGLTVAGVDEDLRAVAAASGSGSQDEKVDRLFGLFNRTSPDEARYVARLVLSEMRIGVGEGSVRDGIAGAFDVPTESVARALQVTNDYGRVAEIARETGQEGLDATELEVGRPIQAMLAQAGTVTEAIDDWDEVAVEAKYDGARVQVHYADAPGDGEIRLFSRNMEDVTDPLPDVVEQVRATVTPPAILDGEVVAVDEAGDPLPFQAVLRRFRRKHDVAKAREEVTVELHAFDCLHAGGDDLLADPLTDRHDRLRAVVDGASVTDLRIEDDADAIESIARDALASGHEGIMLKNPDAEYTPGRRGKNWLKRKPDVETLDLVVTGAEWGEGRRATLLGTFLVAARTGDGFAPVGKVATGITDETLAELTDLLDPYVRSTEGRTLDVEPAVVFEVGYEEIQASPTYDSGYALRFPRFLGVRSDKDPADADSIDRIESLTD